VQRLLNFILVCLVAMVAGGCATNYYNVPRDVYEQKVRVLGIAPILVDGDSDIRHPEKEAVIAALKEANRKNEQELVLLLKDSGAYFAARLLEEDPDQLLTTLVSRRERRDDGGVVYNKFFYKPEEIKQLVARQNLDAIMLVTISGLTKQEKLYSANFLAFLEGDYNQLTMTAQILDRDGTVLWEYPNFRQRLSSSYTPFLALQYPDFDEAKANQTEEVQVKFKTLAGISRALTKGEESSLQQERTVASLYNRQFEAMATLLQPARSVLGGKKEVEKKAEAATK
jgi:hypothetical protein